MIIIAIDQIIGWHFFHADLQRICMFLQNEYDLYDLDWKKDVKYGDIHLAREKEYCSYNFDKSDMNYLHKLFALEETESDRLLSERLLMPAYESMLKISHLFNMLDARGAISVTERPTYIARVRKLARGCAKLYLELENAKEEIEQV